MLEYFIATPGARKGLVDTALRTADSGYLTRRLVDVAQELIINEDDCLAEGDAPVRGLWIEDVAPDRPASAPTSRPGSTAGRWLNDGRRRHADGRALKTARRSRSAAPGTAGRRGRDGGAPRRPRGRAACGFVRRSPATPSELGVCAKCYGRSLATGKMIELGEAVGVIAAQSIGEPGTQLTMRTFHTGGIAGKRHRRRSAPRRRAVRGPQPEGQGHAGPHLGRGAHRDDEGKGGSSPSSATTVPRRTHTVPPSPGSR
jgi:DNA-directed RNA polymerase subunit beta'